MSSTNLPSFGLKPLPLVLCDGCTCPLIKLCIWDARAGCSTPGGFSQRQRHRITSFDLLAAFLPMQHRIRLAFWPASPYCQLMSNFASTRTSKSLSPRLLSIILSSNLYWYWWLPWCRCRTLHLALLNFMRFRQAQSSSLSKTLWMASLPSKKISCTTQLGVISKLAGRALNPTIYVINEDIKQYWSQYGPQRDSIIYWFPFRHWAIDCNSLDVAIQPIPYPSNIPSIKPVSLQCGGKNVVGDCIKGLIEIQVDNVNNSLLVHWCSFSIIECHSQARFALDEAMLTVPNHLPVLHIHRHVFQDNLFHDLTRYGGEANWLVVPRVLLFTLLKNESYVYLFEVSYDIPVQP